MGYQSTHPLSLTEPQHLFCLIWVSLDWVSVGQVMPLGWKLRWEGISGS